MRLRRVLVAVVTLGSLPLGALSGVGRADACRASAHGGASFELRLSSRAGGLCLHTVTVHDGPSCGPTNVLYRTELACSATRRAAVTDRGVLVSILTPRTSHADWAAVRLTWASGQATRTPNQIFEAAGQSPARGAVRLAIEGADLVLRPPAPSAEVRVPLGAFDAVLP